MVLYFVDDVTMQCFRNAGTHWIQKLNVNQSSEVNFIATCTGHANGKTHWIQKLNVNQSSEKNFIATCTGHANGMVDVKDFDINNQIRRLLFKVSTTVITQAV